MDELKILLPAEEVILSTGERVTVSPVPFGRLAAFEGAKALMMMKLQGMSFDMADGGNFKKFLETAAEEVMAVMMVALERERVWFDQILPQDGFALWAVIAQQNFTEDSKKNLPALMEAITSLLPRSSSTSSDEGTALKP